MARLNRRRLAGAQWLLLSLGCLVPAKLAAAPQQQAPEQRSAPPPETPPDEEVIEVAAGPGASASEEEALEVTAGPGAAQPGAGPSAPAPQPSPPPAPGSPASAPEDPAAHEGLEVRVVGTRLQQTPGSAHVVTHRTLERYEYDDPHAALQLVPGVYVRQEDGIGLRPNIGIRGAVADRSKKVTLLEDGVPFAPAPYSASAAYYFPVFTRIYQMRVLKGPSAILHGPQTIGGAVDLITRPIPASPESGFDIAIGDYGYGKLHGYYGSSDEQTGVLIEGVHIRSDGFKELPTGANTGFYRNEWMLKGSHVFDPTSPMRHEVGLKLTYSDEASNETYLGLTDADFRRNPLARYAASALDRVRWFRTGVAATHRIDPAPDVSITTTVYRNDFWRRWRKANHFRGAALFDVLQNPDTAQNAVFYSVLNGQANSSSPAEEILIGPNERDFVSQGVMSRVEIDLRTGPITHDLEYGVRLHYDRVERRHSEDAFLLIDGKLVPAPGRPTNVTTFNEASTEALALHAFDAATWNRLTVTPGVRLEVFRSTFLDKADGTRSGNAEQVVLPGIGAFYALTDDFGVLGGVYRGMSPPAPGSDEQIEPELSVNYEAGARFSRGRSRVELIGFYNDYQNLTDICTFSNGCLDDNLDRQFDAGNARIYGLEAFLEHEFEEGSVKFPVRGAYTLTYAKFRESFQSQDPLFGDVEAGDHLPYVPRHQAFGSIGIEVGRAGGYVSANYVAPMREAAGSEPIDEALTTDEQFTVDLGAHVQVLEWLKLYANVRNVFDELYIVSRRPYGARPNAPRWAHIGAKLEF